MKLQFLVMTELDLLKKPEYIHVVLNHLPIFGTILGALALAISLLLRSRAAQVTALIITLIAGASAYPVFVTGQRAYKAIRGMADDAGAEVLDEHMDRAEKTIGVFYFFGGTRYSRSPGADQMAEIRRSISGLDPVRSNSLFRDCGLYRSAWRSSKAPRISAERNFNSSF